MKVVTFTEPVSKSELSQIILNNKIPETTELEIEVDLETAIGLSKERTDEADLAEEIHKCLRDFPISLLTDQCLWHWMTIVPFQDFVINRWNDSDNLRKWLDSDAGKKRFLGVNSIRGWNENAIARLFWSAQLTVEGEGDYHLTREILNDADLHKNLFDRQMCLDPGLLKVCIRKFTSSDFTDLVNLSSFARRPVYREAIKLARMQLQAKVFEAYNTNMIENLIDDCIQRAIKILELN